MGLFGSRNPRYPFRRFDNYGDYDRNSGYGRYPYNDNAGQIGIDTSGDLTIGIGGGLGIDTKDGDLTVEVVPGISIDTGLDLF